MFHHLHDSPSAKPLAPVHGDFLMLAAGGTGQAPDLLEVQACIEPEFIAGAGRPRRYLRQRRAPSMWELLEPRPGPAPLASWTTTLN